MPGPFIFVATNKVREGKLEGERQRVPGWIDFIQSNEPRLIAFHEYVSADGSRRKVFLRHDELDVRIALRHDAVDGAAHGACAVSDEHENRNSRTHDRVSIVHGLRMH